MAWEIGVIVDPNGNEATVNTLVRYMPIWMADTPVNRLSAAIARRIAGEMWFPEAACTTFTVRDPVAREHNCLSNLDMVDLHHPNMAKLNLVGVESSSTLCTCLKEFGFIPANATWPHTIASRRPVTTLKNISTLELDASKWTNSDDIYESLFTVLGSPVWHGKNFDALNDSIVTSDINSVEVPYILSIRNVKAANSKVTRFVSDLTAFISEREAQGCSVSIKIEDDSQ
jgi:RNAse (barnase) inhibitor barstar